MIYPQYRSLNLTGNDKCFFLLGVKQNSGIIHTPILGSLEICTTIYPKDSDDQSKDQKSTLTTQIRTSSIAIGAQYYFQYVVHYIPISNNNIEFKIPETYH